MKKNFISHLFFLICFVAVASVTFTCEAEAESINPFFFDGCSAVPEGTAEDPNLWCECCLEHDVKYWMGGTWNDKRNADLELKECVTEKSGSETVGLIYYLGVRAGGSAFYDTEYRWGYGWEYGRGYQPLTVEEKADAKQKYEQWVSENPDICADFN